MSETTDGYDDLESPPPPLGGSYHQASSDSFTNYDVDLEAPRTVDMSELLVVSFEAGGRYAVVHSQDPTTPQRLLADPVGGLRLTGTWETTPRGYRLVRKPGPYAGAGAVKLYSFFNGNEVLWGRPHPDGLELHPAGQPERAVVLRRVEA